MSDEKTVRCVQCAAEFTDSEISGAVACPACGCTGVPCAISKDVTLRINWHELRILTIWADNWALKLEPATRKSLHAIIERLEAQRPDGFPSLTIGGEIRDMQASGIDAELRDSHGNVIVPRKARPS